MLAIVLADNFIGGGSGGGGREDDDGGDVDNDNPIVMWKI